MSDLAWTTATLPVGDGGLGLRDVDDNNVQSFVFPLARTIQYAHNGIAPLKYTTTENADVVSIFRLAPSTQRLFAGWDT